MSGRDHTQIIIRASILDRRNAVQVNILGNAILIGDCNKSGMDSDAIFH